MHYDSPPAIIEQAPQYQPGWFENYFPNVRFKVDKMYRDDVIAKTIKEEGGFVDNPNDPGGATNMGITLATLRRIKPAATIDDIRNLNYASAAQIYITEYWNQNQLVHMPIQIQDLVFDMNVNNGLHGSAIIIQRALVNLGSQIDEDGVIGTATLNEINKYDVVTLRAVIDEQRKEWYLDIIKNHPNESEFKNGWMKRVEDFEPIPAEVNES